MRIKAHSVVHFSMVLVASVLLVGLGSDRVFRGLNSSLIAHARETSLVRPPATPAANLPKPTQPQLLSSYARLPLSFEANWGQTNRQVKFQSSGSGYTLFLTSNESVLSLRKPDKPASRRGVGALGAGPEIAGNRAITTTVLRMRLLGANPAANISGLDELPGKSNYFIGNDPKKWRTNVPTFAKVKYANVYPGVDLLYYGNQRELEYDFVVAPGGDPQAIRLGIEGAKKAVIDAQGDLVLRTKGGDVRLHKPAVYQEVGDAKKAVAGQYVLRGEHQVGFKVGAYDASRPLVIDPILSYSTYLGGSDTDFGFGIAVDSAGSAYVTGYTSSTNFPTTSGAFQTPSGGSLDAFVAKLNSTGSALVYSTYLGGNSNDVGIGIAVDSAGSAYVTGYTSSTNFPTTSGAFQTSLGGSLNAFVTKLNSTGSALVYSTYLGGGGVDEGWGIAVDSAGSAYVAGLTSSTNFPTTPGAFQTSSGGSFDGFVTKLNPAGSALVYSTYLGGSSVDECLSIAVDSTGSAYVTGPTDSANFPTTPGAAQTSFGGVEDAFVTKLNAAGSALVYSTYVGGSNQDEGLGIAVDSTGSAYVAGLTASTNFPTTSGAFQTTYAGGSFDGFITKVNATGSALVYSTFLGGAGNDQGLSIALDSAGNAYVTGFTDSSNFPTANPIQPTAGGGGDAFVTKLNATGNALIYSTYLGGSSSDTGFGIAVDSTGSAYVNGVTSSTNFPTTSGAFQTSFGGGSSDAFVAKITEFACSAQSTNASNFNGTSIAGGDYIWFNANFSAKGIPSTGATLILTNSTISFTAGNTPYTLAVPNALITFSPSATCTSTTFNSTTNTWVTTVPVTGDDEIFLTGLAWPVPSTGLPGGINPVDWTGTFGTGSSGLSVHWKWGAAVYSNFTTNYNALAIKAGHQTACAINNGDHAGTPEGLNVNNQLWKQFVVGGARGGGGSNWTGSWSGTQEVTPVCSVQ